MKGQLEIFSRHVKTGKRDLMVRTPNLVLNGMYEQLIQLISAGDPQAFVDRMQFGTGTLAPAASQQFLQRPITPLKNVIATVDAANYKVTFQASLLSDEANGFPISEAGLLASNDTVVARAIFSARAKTSDFVFDFNWIVTLKS